MSEIEQQATGSVQAEELDDFDVEGHGLKEIAIGLSAATVVAGGAGAMALALDNPLPGTKAGAQAAVAGVQSDAADRLGWADGVAQGAVGDARQTVNQVSSAAIGAVQPIGQQATSAAGDAVRTAGEVVADPVGTTDRIADGAVGTAREIRDGAVVTTKGAGATAQQVAADSVSAAEGAVAETSELAQLTAASAYGVVDPSVQASSQDDGSTTVTVTAADKSVSVRTGG